MNRDYSQIEIDNIIEELMTVHHCKLRVEEIEFLTGLTVQHTISNNQRDTLIKLYDAIGESGY